MIGTQLSRRIDGKLFHRDNSYSTKTEAKKKAKWLRSRGMNARVAYNKYEGWVVYWSEMTWVHKKPVGKGRNKEYDKRRKELSKLPMVEQSRIRAELTMQRKRGGKKK